MRTHTRVWGRLKGGPDREIVSGLGSPGPKRTDSLVIWGLPARRAPTILRFRAPRPGKRRQYNGLGAPGSNRVDRTMVWGPPARRAPTLLRFRGSRREQRRYYIVFVCPRPEKQRQCCGFRASDPKPKSADSIMVCGLRSRKALTILWFWGLRPKKRRQYNGLGTPGPKSASRTMVYWPPA